MAAYEYVCRVCGFKFDALQPVGARDFATCPRCSCVADKKLSTFNFGFGFRLSDESLWVDGAKDELVRNV